MSYIPPHKVEIDNEDLFELKAWLEEMRVTRYEQYTWDRRSESCRALDRRLAIFEKIMRQLP